MTTTDLITFDGFKARLGGGVTLRTIRRLMAQGRWPRAVRLSPSGPLLWSQAAIEQHLASAMAGLDVPE